MQKILKEIQAGNIKNFYLIFGEENYLKDYFISQVKKILIPEEFADMNFNMISDDIESIINSASSLPFMNKNRLTVIRDSGLFYTGKKNETEKFLNALNNFHDSSVILFCETKIDKRNKLYKKISERGQICEIKKPSNKELTKWIIKVCEANKKIISQQNASLILEITMHDMNFLKNELEKLIAYTSSSQIKNIGQKIDINQEINHEITEKDINLLCTKSLEAKIFDLVAAMGNKNLKTAIENYNNLHEQKQ